MVIRKFLALAVIVGALVVTSTGLEGQAFASVNCSTAQVALHRLADAESRVADATIRFNTAESGAVALGETQRALRIEVILAKFAAKQTALSARVARITQACPAA
jgi:hypothetical protein